MIDKTEVFPVVGPGQARTNEATFNTWRGMGSMALKQSKLWLDSPYEAGDRFMDRLLGSNLGAISEHEREVQQVAIRTNCVQMGRWAMAGYPTVRPTHRACASWMATDFNNVPMEHIHAPWPAFVIRVPDNMLWLVNWDGDHVPVTVISAAHLDGDRWFYTLATDPVSREEGGYDGLSVWAYGVNTQMMVGGKLPKAPHEWQTIENTDTDKRAEQLARRLILGVCMYYSDPARLDEHKRVSKPKRVKKGRTPDTLPTYTSWEMRSEISIDVVRAVKHWSATGEGNSPKVQGMVAGHPRHQAYGPKWSLHRWIHIEPFWRGLEDAPVVGRSGK
jgi:hypothetical protein